MKLLEIAAGYPEYTARVLSTQSNKNGALWYRISPLHYDTVYAFVQNTHTPYVENLLNSADNALDSKDSLYIDVQDENKDLVGIYYLYVSGGRWSIGVTDGSPKNIFIEEAINKLLGTE